jgi:hypothetical protein
MLGAQNGKQTLDAEEHKKMLGDDVLHLVDFS